MADLGQNFRFPGGVNEPVPGRHNIEDVTAIIQRCHLALFSRLPCALLVHQRRRLLHHFAYEQRIVGKHT